MPELLRAARAKPDRDRTRTSYMPAVLFLEHRPQSLHFQDVWDVVTRHVCSPALHMTLSHST